MVSKRSGKLVVRLELQVESSKKAEAINRALEVDDLLTPPQIIVECQSSADKIIRIFEVDLAESKNILTLKNTLNDFFRCFCACYECLRLA